MYTLHTKRATFTCFVLNHERAVDLEATSHTFDSIFSRGSLSAFHLPVWILSQPLVCFWKRSHQAERRFNTGGLASNTCNGISKRRQVQLPKFRDFFALYSSYFPVCLVAYKDTARCYTTGLFDILKAINTSLEIQLISWFFVPFLGNSALFFFTADIHFKADSPDI